MDIINGIIKEFKGLKRELRAFYLMHFRPKYVQRQLETRKGICGMHGCCGMSFVSRFRRCLSKDKVHCVSKELMTKRCLAYPIDEKDKAIGTESFCNFYWEEK